MKLFSVGVLFAAAVSQVYAQTDAGFPTDFGTDFGTDFDFGTDTFDPNAYYTSIFGAGGVSLITYLETHSFTTPSALASWISRYDTWTGGAVPPDFPYGAYSQFITQYYFLTQLYSDISGFSFEPFTISGFTVPTDIPTEEATGTVLTATDTGGPTAVTATGTATSDEVSATGSSASKDASKSASKEASSGSAESSESAAAGSASSAAGSASGSASAAATTTGSQGGGAAGLRDAPIAILGLSFALAALVLI